MFSSMMSSAHRPPSLTSPARIHGDPAKPGMRNVTRSLGAACYDTRTTSSLAAPGRSRGQLQVNLDLLSALWRQAEKETLPWVADLVTPWFAGRPAPLTGTVEPQELADADSKFVKVGIVDVHYKEAVPASATYDNSTALLLIHGFNGSTFNWRLVMQDLAEATGLRVVAFDRPPFGLSSRPLQWDGDQENPYTADAGVRLAVGLMDALGIQTASLVGHSAGATVAVQTALRYSQRVSSLVLVSPAVPVDDTNFLRQAGLSQQLRYAYTRLLLQTEAPAVNYVRRMINNRSDQVKSGRLDIYYDEANVPLEVIEGYLKPMQAKDWDQAYLLMLRAFSVSPAPSWKAVQQPVLLVQGEFDRTVPTTRVQKLLARIRAERAAENSAEGAGSAVYVELEQCGHLPPEECPSQFVKAVEDFLQAVPSGGSDLSSTAAPVSQ